MLDHVGEMMSGNYTRLVYVKHTQKVVDLNSKIGGVYKFVGQVLLSLAETKMCQSASLSRRKAQ